MTRCIDYIIPMAGRGSRFSAAGYTKPKWLLEAHGKTLLEWSVDSLPLAIANKLIFIALKEDAQRYNLSDFVKRKYGGTAEVVVVLIGAPTRGQAETVLYARKHVAQGAALGIFNIDTRFDSPTLKACLLREKIDGVVGAFASQKPSFSYAKLDGEYVCETAEKKVISPWALTGFYAFAHAGELFTLIEQQIAGNKREAGEFYIAPLYNAVIARGGKVIIDVAAQIDILGTPDEYNEFLVKPAPL